MSSPDVESMLNAVRLALYQDDIPLALELLRAPSATRDPRCVEEFRRIRSSLAHLETRDAYVAEYERYYRTVKGGMRLKWLERELRILTGRKARKAIARGARDPEYRLLEREVDAIGARRALDAGCGEGRIALTLGARRPHVAVDGVEISPTNLRIARQQNRWANVTFHQGLIEEASAFLPREEFDLAYAFGVLEHVRDVGETIRAIFTLLRPGGRLCLVLPMNELAATGPLSEVVIPHGHRGHVRRFTETRLRRLFGGYAGYTLQKIPGRFRKERYPKEIVPVEFGSFFVAISKDR